MTGTPAVCRACGAGVSGRFCSECGTPVGALRCAACDAELSSGARFCHRCGQAVAGGGGAPGVAAAQTTGASLGSAAGGGGGSDRTVWIAAALVILVALGAIVWHVVRGDPEPAGGAAAQSTAGLEGPALSGPAPDISQMSPRERFDRLFNRVMTAAEQGDTATIVNFTPMALGAYAQLDTVNVDARYHAAVLNAQVGNYAAARALADTILAEVPGHLFGHVIRGEVARIEGDEATLARAHRGFLEAWDAEMAANRVEYLEHRPVLDRFRAEAAP